MGQCNNTFLDFLTMCGYYVRVNAVFIPATVYTWVITDKFNNQYSGTVTTESDGAFYIPVSDLPTGLLNPHSGTFTMRIQDTACQWLPLRMMAVYDSITFDVRGGTAVKDELGCEIDCTISGTPSNSAAFEYLGVSSATIEWTLSLRQLYGNTPLVQVYQRTNTNVYQLVSVQVTYNAVESILQSLDIDFGGVGNFLVIVRG